jgi:hypothetical protein
MVLAALHPVRQRELGLENVEGGDAVPCGGELADDVEADETETRRHERRAVLESMPGHSVKSRAPVAPAPPPLIPAEKPAAALVNEPLLASPLPQNQRQPFWPGRKQLRHRAGQNLRQNPEFGVVDPPQSGLDLRKAASAQVPACELHLRRQRLLGQAGSRPEPSDLRSDEILGGCAGGLFCHAPKLELDAIRNIRPDCSVFRAF